MNALAEANISITISWPYSFAFAEGLSTKFGKFALAVKFVFQLKLFKIVKERFVSALESLLNSSILIRCLFEIDVNIVVYIPLRLADLKKTRSLGCGCEKLFW